MSEDVEKRDTNGTERRTKIQSEPRTSRQCIGKTVATKLETLIRRINMYNMKMDGRETGNVR